MCNPIIRRSVLAAGLVAGAAAGLARPATAITPSSEPAGIAFTHVTVIDCTGARPRPDMTVLVRGDKIVALGRSGNIGVPAAMSIVDLRAESTLSQVFATCMHTCRIGRTSTRRCISLSV